MELQLRIAEEPDEHAVYEVDARARQGDAERMAFVSDAIEHRRCLVAESHKIVGYTMTTPRGFFGRDFIDLLAVHEDYRRRGVGRALLRAAVNRAGTTRVFSSTNASNAPMRSMLATEGWTFSGRLDGLDEGDPEFVYFTDTTGSSCSSRGAGSQAAVADPQPPQNAGSRTRDEHRDVALTRF